MRDTFVRDNEIHSNKRGNCLLVEVKEDQSQETVVLFFIVFSPLNAPDTV